MSSSKLLSILTILCVGVSIIKCTNVNKCSSGAYSNVNATVLSKRVSITDCNEQPCIIPKGTPSNIAVLFKPTEPVHALIVSMKANFLGSFSLPFFGISGKNVCSKVTKPDGSPAPCPLAANKTYMFVQPIIIPRIALNIPTYVRFSLQSNNKDVFCFEVNVIPK